ncbi:MAG TPA: hypothetical protein VK306_09060 [Acidimicrobiales bacterium]|nr:hypothetical protein [Acidimicrobiales bacterium]
MDSDRAELSALSSSLDDLTARITAVADRLRTSPRPETSDGLYEVERSLTTAGRQLNRVLRDLR